MTAFLELLNTYAIFFYIAGVVAVLFGIKMLLDARRASRTTLFTLEQEQASDRAFRAVLVMLGATLFIGGVAGINAFVAPALPTPTPDSVEPTAIPFTPPVVLRTVTSQPTLTLPPPTPGAATVAPTRGAVVPTSPVAPTQPVATPPPTAPVAPPTAVPTTSALIYPSPPLNTPPDGDSIGSNRIRFSWGFNPASEKMDVPELLPQDQFYRLVITFTDKTKNAPAALVLCTHETSADQRTGINVSDYRNEAVDNLFRWSVVAVSASSQEACLAGDVAPLSPPSATFSFVLP
jgi:hypothetical protein